MAQKATQKQGITNAQARSLFYASALRKSQIVLPNQTPSLGGTLQFLLPKAGIARGVLLNFNVPVTIATAGLIPGLKAPYSLVQNVQLTDYSGIQRVNCSGWGLYLMELLKSRSGWEPSSIYPYAAGGPVGADPYAAGNSYPFGISGLYTSKAAQGGSIGPSYVTSPTQTASRWQLSTGTGSGNIIFSLWVPIAYDMNDIRGSLLLNVPNGNTTLSVTLANSLVSTTAGADNLYSSATGTCVLNSPANTNIVATLYYFDPVPVAGVPMPNSIPLPWEDLSLIHEVRSGVDASGLSAGVTKQMTLSSGRDYSAWIASVVENGTFNSSHLQRLDAVYDGSTPLISEYLSAHIARLQREIGREPPDGHVFLDWSDRPLDANSYGSLGLNLLTASNFVNSGSTYVELITDALYSTVMSNA